MSWADYLVWWQDPVNIARAIWLIFVVCVCYWVGLYVGRRQLTSLPIPTRPAPPMPACKPPRRNPGMKIERTADRVVLLPTELLQLIAEHIEKETNRKIDGVPHISSQSMGGTQSVQYIATARLKDPE